MAVQISAKCFRCNYIFPEIWVDRDAKGFPDPTGVTCQECGTKGCVKREWSQQAVNAIIPPLEDGQINRVEVNYTNDHGKKITKKIDPYVVRRQLEGK